MSVIFCLIFKGSIYLFLLQYDTNSRGISICEGHWQCLELGRATSKWFTYLPVENQSWSLSNLVFSRQKFWFTIFLMRKVIFSSYFNKSDNNNNNVIAKEIAKESPAWGWRQKCSLCCAHAGECCCTHFSQDRFPLITQSIFLPAALVMSHWSRCVLVQHWNLNICLKA